MLDTLSIVVLCLFTAFVLSELFRKLHYPTEIAQILAGIVLTIPAIHVVFTDKALSTVSFLSDLGVIFLLLLTGLQLNLAKFVKVERDVLIIAAFSVFFPFVFGFILMKLLGYSSLVGFVVGAALSLTAEGTKLKVLMDLRALNTKLGVIIIGAGILDDIFEILFLSAVILLAAGDVAALVWIPAKILLFIAIVYLSYRFLPLLIRFVHQERSRISTFSAILIFALFVAVLSNQLDLGPVIGAFIAGILIHLVERKRSEHYETVHELKIVTFSIAVPFFFIYIGLNLDLAALIEHWWLIILITFAATASKLIGALVATPFTDLSFSQTHVIGWAMNSRGAVELVIAEVARRAGLITPEIYTGLVIMAILTTVTFPLVIRHLIRHNHKLLG